MYILAHDVLTFYTNEFVESHYVNTTEKRSRRKTFDLKNSYIRGFLSGIKEKFEDQFNQLKEEYGLVVLTPVPVEVDKAYEEMSKDWGANLKYSLPTIEEIEAYHKGFQDGNTVDYTKSTIDDEILV